VFFFFQVCEDQNLVREIPYIYIYIDELAHSYPIIIGDAECALRKLPSHTKLCYVTPPKFFASLMTWRAGGRHVDGVLAPACHQLQSREVVNKSSLNWQIRMWWLSWVKLMATTVCLKLAIMILKFLRLCELLCKHWNIRIYASNIEMATFARFWNFHLSSIACDRT
jgi:hypothetical protein